VGGGQCARGCHLNALSRALVPHRASAAGGRRQIIELLNPVNEKVINFMATDAMDYPCRWVCVVTWWLVTLACVALVPARVCILRSPELLNGTAPPPTVHHQPHMYCPACLTQQYEGV
jgi:hypothetical protein